MRVLGQLASRGDVATCAALLLVAPIGLLVDSEKERALTMVIPELNRMGLRGYYRQVLEDTSDAIRQILLVCADPERYPILVHCTGGKDRTGVVVALIQSLLGVPRESIEEEFHASEVWLEEVSTANAEVSVGLYEAHMHRAPKEAIRDLLEYVDSEYGSVAGYLRSIGFGDEDQERLRQCVLADAQRRPQPRSRL